MGDQRLEIDTLTNGMPVESIPQHGSDVVELPFVHGQLVCHVEDGLQSSHNGCGTFHRTVIVSPTRADCMHEQC